MSRYQQNFKKINTVGGFTLIELLVVSAVIGILAVVSATVFTSILRSQNKTTVINEVRQNGNLVIDKFERDVRQSRGICNPTGPPCSGMTSSVTLTTFDGESIVWACVEEAAGPPVVAGRFTRQVGSGAAQSITSRDPKTGTTVKSCSNAFLIAGEPSDASQLVTLEFTLEDAVDSPNRADFEIEVPFRASVGTRSF